MILLLLSGCVTIKGDLVLFKEGNKDAKVNPVDNASSEKSDSGRIPDNSVGSRVDSIRSTLFGGHATSRPSGNN